MSGWHYERDGQAIYRQSFAIIRAEADLSAFDDAEAEVAVRMIHACGLVEAVRHFRFAPGLVSAARAALAGGAAILCDAEMAARGVTRARLPADNRVICTLRDTRTADLASRRGTTRSAAAMELWGDDLAGALVVIGNAPTALFHLFEMLADGAPNRRRSSACRSASSARRNRNKRSPRAPPGRFPGPPSVAAWAAARSPPPLSTPSPGRGFKDTMMTDSPAPQARLFGVGTGPGDPDLLTVKAARLIETADVIAYFAKRGHDSHARRAVAARIPAAAIDLPLLYPCDHRIGPQKRRLHRRHRRLFR